MTISRRRLSLKSLLQNKKRSLKPLSTRTFKKHTKQSPLAHGARDWEASLEVLSSRYLLTPASAMNKSSHLLGRGVCQRGTKGVRRGGARSFTRTHGSQILHNQAHKRTFAGTNPGRGIRRKGSSGHRRPEGTLNRGGFEGI